MTLRTFSNIQIGHVLAFDFGGRRFYCFCKLYDAVTASPEDFAAVDVDISMYGTELWRRNHEVTDEEWEPFVEQFKGAAKAQAMSIGEIFRERAKAQVRDEEDRRRRAAQLAAEKERRSHERYTRLRDSLWLVEYLGDHVLLVEDDEFGDRRIPVSKELYERLAIELAA